MQNSMKQARGGKVQGGKGPFGSRAPQGRQARLSLRAAIAEPVVKTLNTKRSEQVRDGSHGGCTCICYRGSAPAAVQVFKEAQELLPGGVNSPVRAFRSVGGGPIVFDRVKGAYAWDVDGNKARYNFSRDRGVPPGHLLIPASVPVQYIDYVGSWGPAIVGHANDEVNDVIIKQLQKGASFGAPCELEVCTLFLRL
jgi:hypothetical protein